MSAFNTPFPHRVNACLDGEFINLMDAINPSLLRAAALADLLEVACEVADDAISFQPNTLWRAAEAIRLEINDARVLLNAYWEAEKARTTHSHPKQQA